MAVKVAEVHLLNVPFGKDYKHTPYFPSAATQYIYFSRRKVHSFTDFTYQRKDNIIRVPMHIDDLYNCNYVMYRNNATEKPDQVFYAFITDMKYVNDTRTDIYIETDVMQTWMHEITILPSFVEREHVSDDTIGLHTIPEGLETGEYVIAGYAGTNSLKNAGIVLASTVNLSQMTYDDGAKCGSAGGAVYGGVFSGVYYYYFSMSEEGTASVNKGLGALVATLKCLESMGQSDAVLSIFMVPEDYIQIGNTQTISVASGDLDIQLQQISRTTGATVKSWNASGSGDSPIYKPTQIDGYSPKNNKLLTYPYVYLNMSNNSGGNAIYHYELFDIGNTSKTTCDFDIIFTVCPGGSLKVAPKNYKNSSYVFEEGLTGGKFPICAWNSDTYINWLTQNSVNLEVSTAMAVGQIVGGATLAVGSGGIAGTAGLAGVLGGLSSIANVMGEKAQHYHTAPQARGNLNNGDVTFASGYLIFSAFRMNIRAEYAQIIDQYFDMFGYKVNTVKVPNVNHRQSWWYTKTIDVNIEGAIPNDDLNKIKGCYNNGITFWYMGNGLGDYSRPNGIK